MRNGKSILLRDLGIAILKKRRELGLSQEELSFRAQLHRTYIGDIERGNRNISIKAISAIAEALECDMCQLFSPPYFSLRREK